MVEELLHGGNVSGPVVRVDETVRRRTGPWTPAVHRLLRHLEQKGFEGAPRVLGTDEQGREILTYLPGIAVTSESLDEHLGSDDALAAMALLLRRYHDAVADFPTDGVWRNWYGELEREIVCHHDCAPWNLIVGPDGPFAFIDWDWAGPGPRLWDVAYAAQSSVSLTVTETADIDHRLELFCDAYGLTRSERVALPDVIVERTAATHDALVRLATAGEEPWRTLASEGHADGWGASLAFVREHRDAWIRLLSS